MSASAFVRFWSKVHVRGANECWPWRSTSTTPNGYGVAWFDLGEGPRCHTAHRVAFFLANGRAPGADLDVMHSCDCRLCCNPAHLSEGTRQDNMRDAAAKGRTNRSPRVQGEQVHSARLKVGQVIEIRAALAGGEAVPPIARRYGVTREIIYGIRDGRTWKSVGADHGLRFLTDAESIRAGRAA